MSKYTAKKTKKQDIIDKSTKKKRKNGVLAYFMEKLVSENLVSENMLELVKECNTFMMMVADESIAKKKQHIRNTCNQRFFPYCALKLSLKDVPALSVMIAYLKQEEKN